MRKILIAAFTLGLLGAFGQGVAGASGGFATTCQQPPGSTTARWVHTSDTVDHVSFFWSGAHRPGTQSGGHGSETDPVSPSTSGTLSVPTPYVGTNPPRPPLSVEVDFYHGDPVADPIGAVFLGNAKGACTP